MQEKKDDGEKRVVKSAVAVKVALMSIAQCPCTAAYDKTLNKHPPISFTPFPANILYRHNIESSHVCVCV